MRCICLMDHPIPNTKDALSTQVLGSYAWIINASKGSVSTLTAAPSLFDDLMWTFEQSLSSPDHHPTEAGREKFWHLRHHGLVHNTSEFSSNKERLSPYTLTTIFIFSVSPRWPARAGLWRWWRPLWRLRTPRPRSSLGLTCLGPSSRSSCKSVLSSLSIQEHFDWTFCFGRSSDWLICLLTSVTIDSNQFN